MAFNGPQTPLERCKLDAESRASKWLADSNEARESGNIVKADQCHAKSQFRLDRANLLNNRAVTAAPRK